ncbi:2-oxoisovalerate dehydrogenase subunit beta [bacterium MnTg02]|nr:2-oxoisovalerate dehydrogenase subunit beta [bacterium MnTg02]
MPTEVLMPALSPTMEEGKLAKWLVSEGDEIAPGDVIAEIETDKATMEIEAVDQGRLGKILIREGTEGVKVNTPIAVLLSDGEEEDGGAMQSGSKAPSAADTLSSIQSQIRKIESARIDAPTDAPTEGPVASGAADMRDPELPIDAEIESLTVREALRDAMAEEMRRDRLVFIMGEEVGEYQGAYKITQGLLDEFGDHRVIDTPITEHGFCGVGVGAALAGLKPIVEFMTWNFGMQAIDQIINSAAKTLYMSGGQMRCPIVFRGPNGPAARVAAQHSQCFSAWYAHIPGLKVVAPYSAADAKGLLKSAIRDPNPVVFLEHEILYGQSFDVPKQDEWLVPIGKARVAREGRDVTIVSFSRAMNYALEAADILAAQGLEAEVIDLRTLRPLDTQTIIKSLQKTNAIVVVEESWPVCSVGSEICAIAARDAFDYLDAPPVLVAGVDVPMPYAANLEALALPTAEQVVAAVKSVCYTDK